MTNNFVDDWNEDLSQEIELAANGSMVVFSRDWTVETIVSQIRQENIKLNPRFQRRHAWEDIRRSRLIESLIIGVPVPEIILAEEKSSSKSFIVIDGKQRLSTLAGFFSPDQGIWDQPKLQGLTARPDLLGLSIEELQTNPSYRNDYRNLINADIRCTVLSNYSEEKVLFDVFYRLNTGSVPLSSQELRQVLYPGPFAEYLFQITNTVQPIHRVLDIDQPDPRLRDIELILRIIAFMIFDDIYNGNLNSFLNYSMKTISNGWSDFQSNVEDAYRNINSAIEKLSIVFGETSLIGRKPTPSRKRSLFNKALFESLIISFVNVPHDILTPERNNEFKRELQRIAIEDLDFRTSIESTTKSIENYYNRFSILQHIINNSYGTDVNYIPIATRL